MAASYCSIMESATRGSPRSTRSSITRSSATANGGAEQVRDWSRLFLVPGMGHCGGGTATLDQFDLLTRRRRLGRDGPGAELGRRDGRCVPGSKPPAVPVSAARALQRHGRFRERCQLRVPLRSDFGGPARAWPREHPSRDTPRSHPWGSAAHIPVRRRSREGRSRGHARAGPPKSRVFNEKEPGCLRGSAVVRSPQRARVCARR